MINLDDYANKSKTKHNSDNRRLKIIIGGSGSEKTNALLNLINNQQTLTKYICILKIRMKRNINF